MRDIVSGSNTVGKSEMVGSLLSGGEIDGNDETEGTVVG